MPVDAPDPTYSDLSEVDLLCRLALSAKRLGCRIHLSGVSPELRSLIDEDRLRRKAEAKAEDDDADEDTSWQP